MDNPIKVTRPGNDELTSQLLLTPEQAATTLAICRTKLYELLRTGQLESVQIGSSRRVPAAALSEYVQRLRDQARVPVGSWDQRPTVLRRRQGC
jgi:excisionase family DNA binding protein